MQVVKLMIFDNHTIATYLCSLCNVDIIISDKRELKEQILYVIKLEKQVDTLIFKTRSFKYYTAYIVIIYSVMIYYYSVKQKHISNESSLWV